MLVQLRRFGFVLTVCFTVAVTAIVGVAGQARADELRCDGTDPFFFEEMKNAGTLGYGETWDETICDQGLAVYGEGATSRWQAFKQKRPYKNPEDQMLALVMPMFAMGGIAAVFLAASGLAFASRLRKRIVLEVACPACETGLPIPLDDKSARNLFCPACGAACAIDVVGKGKQATATARLLS